MNGCLSILVFGFFFMLAGLLLNVLRFGISIWRSTRAFRRTMKDFTQGTTSAQENTGNRKTGSRSSFAGQKPGQAKPASGDSKIFGRDEGQYVDFEEMK